MASDRSRDKVIRADDGWLHYRRISRSERAQLDASRPPVDAAAQPPSRQLPAVIRASAMVVNVQLTLFAVLILEAEALGISIDHVIKAFIIDRVRFRGVRSGCEGGKFLPNLASECDGAGDRAQRGPGADALALRARDVQRTDGTAATVLVSARPAQRLPPHRYGVHGGVVREHAVPLDFQFVAPHRPDALCARSRLPNTRPQVPITHIAHRRFRFQLYRDRAHHLFIDQSN